MPEYDGKQDQDDFTDDDCKAPPEFIWTQAMYRARQAAKEFSRMDDGKNIEITDTPQRRIDPEWLAEQLGANPCPLSHPDAHRKQNTTTSETKTDSELKSVSSES